MSVLMVTYNHEPFIAQAVESALAQHTTFDVEVVVGEDCSTDGTRHVLLDLEQRHPGRLRLLFPARNLGPTGNMLQTLAACRGDFIALLEGDDFWTDPEKLELQYELLRDNPRAFTCGARAMVWKFGDAAPAEVSPDGAPDVLARYGARELFDNTWWHRTCTKMFPAPLLRAIPPRFMRDWAGTLWLIAHTNFGDVAFLDRVVGVYREHASGSWSTMHQDNRLAQDIITLFRVTPLFRGTDRDSLLRLLHQHVGELVGATPPMSLAILATIRELARAPWSPISWRHVRATLRQLPGAIVRSQ